MKPLALKIQPAGTPEGLRANVHAALARNLPEFVPGLVVHDGTMVLVGSGPSMPQYVEQIRQEQQAGRPIFAVKGAHDYLCTQGITPDLYLCIDPNPQTHPAHALTGANDTTLYLLASLCDPSMFDALAGRRVMLVHAWSPESHCEEYTNRVLVGGGSTTGLRAITVSYLLGFRRMTLYGYDSCLASDRTTKRFSGEVTPQDRIVDVIVEGRRFWANGAMAQQAQELQQYYVTMPDLHLEAVGDGLIAAILEARRKRELPV
jgi:uncharacterized Rossmann fold enzyme